MPCFALVLGFNLNGSCSRFALNLECIKFVARLRLDLLRLRWLYLYFSLWFGFGFYDLLRRHLFRLRLGFLFSHFFLISFERVYIRLGFWFRRFNFRLSSWNGWIEIAVIKRLLRSVEILLRKFAEIVPVLAI